ncbi:hypothetical protein EYC80_001136 [Monilinia laxa]|uniref:Uncharacterized protein n=1 Tax=Monilinia laxa TaxID=61186 RepID=A0A5N6K966_MONLA|nr:hypothetical protein EYC80_001136 [Monilinia laxa]
MRVTYDFMRLRQHTFVWHLPDILGWLGRIWLSGRLRLVTVFSVLAQRSFVICSFVNRRQGPGNIGTW